MTHSPHTALVNRVHTTLIQHAMCAPGDHLLVALSGGADSMTLLHALHHLVPTLRLTLSVAHLHHGIRGEEALKDQRFSQEAARGLALPFFTREVDVPALARQTGLGLEETARKARHAFLHEVATSCGAVRIALGHHKGDMAEQLLLNLMRGSGLKGLGAMEPVTGEGVIRPLLELTREEISAWLTAQGIRHVTDATNSDTAYTRNRVRHRLIPLMEEAFNPSIVTTLARTAALLREEEAWVHEMTTTLYTDCLITHEETRVVLSAEKLRSIHPAAKKRVLRRAIEALCGSTRTLTSAHILSLQRLVESGPKGGAIDLSRRVRGLFTGATLHLLLEGESLRTAPSHRPQTPPSFFYTVEKPIADHTLYIPETGDRLIFRWRSAPKRREEPPNPLHIFLPPNALTFPLVVRTTIPGDRFRPLGGRGSRKIGKFLADCHTPSPLRSQIPLVISNETILWVAGYRQNEAPAPPAPGTPALEIVLQKCKKG